MDDKALALATLQAAKDSADWAYWSMIGTWFAGVATFLAVVTSLFIAYRRPRPRINGEIEISEMMSNPSKRGIGISISNIGLTPLTISSLIWHFGAKSTLMHTFDPISMKLPAKLGHGESAFFFIHNDRDVRWDRDMKKVILDSGGKTKKLRLAVNFGTKDKYFIKPNKDVMKLIEKS